MGKGKRGKGKRKKQADREKSQDTTLLHPFLQKYPEGNLSYLRHVSTRSGEVLTEDQEWITLPQVPLDLRIDLETRSEIVVTVNEEFQVLAIPVSLKNLSCEKDIYKKYKLLKGARKKFAINSTKTIHLGTLKFYQDLEPENLFQKDPDEGRIHMGADDIILQLQDPKSKNWLSLPHEKLTFNYDQGGYIYSCSVLENEGIKPPYEYETYTIFNAPPQRIALALGIDFGNHLIKGEMKITKVPEIRVFFGKVEYMEYEEQFDLYRRGVVLSSNRIFREDLPVVFTKIPSYSHQNEFRFFITLDNVQWNFKSNPSLEVSMSRNFQLHCGFTYFTDESEQHRNSKKPTSTQ